MPKVTNFGSQILATKFGFVPDCYRDSNIEKNYLLVSNIRCTSNIRRSPILGNSQLKFSPTISLAKTSNTRCTRVLTRVSIVDKVPTWSKLLRVAWDFDSPWITGPMTANQSVAFVRHVTLAPAANFCTLSAIVFLPIKAWIWCHLCRYIGSAILLIVKGPIPYDLDRGGGTPRKNQQGALRVRISRGVPLKVQNGTQQC